MSILATQTSPKNDSAKKRTVHAANGAARSQSVDTSRVSTLKIKRSELIMLTTQLSVMIDSGVVLSDALDAISSQSQEGNLKIVVEHISDSVKNGESFSQAISDYPKIFNPMFISMVRASEASGKMSEMLRIVSSYLEFEYETRKRIKGALTYPVIMVLIAILATGMLMFFVLPRFIKIYESRSAALPKLTQVLVDLSNMMRDFRVMSVALAAGVVAALVFYNWAVTQTGRRTLDYIKIRIPVFGTMFVDMIITRSMRIMATMLNTGVSLLDTVDVVRGSCSNYYFQQLWGWVDDKIRNGYQLSEAIQLSPDKWLIAPQIIQMIRAGEKSGNLGKVSDKISVFYEKKFESSVNTATKLIEPIMLVVLGAVIGTIAIALLLPVFRISSIIAH
jgi:type IV pilus assembly protein PilC